MEYIATIISISCTAAGLLATAITFIARFIKAAKDKKKAADINKICEAILLFITQAEGFLNYNGREKKEFVTTKVNQFAIEKKIAFDSQLVSTKIEELVKLTREVNAREKDRVQKSIIITAKGG